MFSVTDYFTFKSFIETYILIKRLISFFSNLPSIRVKLFSNLPIGEGLGSSASFSVSVAAALLLNQNIITGNFNL